MSRRRVVLVACGSFNPVTNMHLRMFEIARDHLHRTGQFQVVGGIVSPVNDGYKKKDLVEAKHRCRMLDLALCSSDWIKLDSWECSQDNWLETVKVLAHHQKEIDSRDANDNTINLRKKQKLDLDNGNVNYMPIKDEPYTWSNHPTQVKLLCGADLLESFGDSNIWNEDDVAEIIGKYGIVVVSREGSNPQRFIYESDTLSKLQRNIIIVTEWITNEISSSRIRRAISRGESVKYLLQDDVIKYIQEHNLYRKSDNKYSIYLTPSPIDGDILDPIGFPTNYILPLVHGVYGSHANFNHECESVNSMEHPEQETAV